MITDLRALGGAEQMLVKLAHRLPGHGIEMSVVSLGGVGDLGARIREAGVPVMPLDIGSVAGLPLAVLRLAREIRRREVDIVQTWLYHGDLIGTFANLLAGRRPLAWNLRCSDIDLSLDNRGTAAIRWLLARLSSMPDIVLANAQAGIAYHHGLGYRPRAEAVIANGFDGTVFRPDPVARAALRAEWGFAPEQVLIGMGARVAPMKDHAGFLLAARYLADMRPDIRFVLAGTGTEPDSALAGRAAEMGLRDRVRMLGPRSDMHRVFAAVDIATLSSAYGEGFPNVLGEAMLCGTPCVVTDVGDVAGIVGDTGLIVPPRDPVALGNAWLRMAETDSATRASLAEAARARIMARYDLDVIARSYAETYRGMVGATAGASR